jgi:OFA family oxalate/formate antiporter-like MFS transporter
MPAHLGLAGIAAGFAAVCTLLAAAATPWSATALLAAAGFGYGALIAWIPAAIARLAPPAAARPAFGRVFTAWGLAGLAGPWIAGLLFEQSGSYRLALLLAAALAFAAAIIAGSRRI